MFGVIFDSDLDDHDIYTQMGRELAASWRLEQ